MRAIILFSILGFAAVADVTADPHATLPPVTDVKPWTDAEFKNDPEAFQFAIVTDRTGGHRPGVFMDGVNKINLLQPEFVVSVGDLIEGYTENREEMAREWDEFNGFVDALEMPFFYLPGNHDISNPIMRQEWDERFGTSYYHWVYKDVLFLSMNSEDPPSDHVSDEQVAYFEKALAENTEVRWTIVLIHKPLWLHGPDTNWPNMEALFKDRKHTVFAGHRHHYNKIERNDSDYIVLATTGGGSSMRGANFGEFDHFAWVTMTPEGPRIANLLLSGIWDTNIITDKRMALIRPLLAGAAVKTDGIVADSGKFSKAKTTLRLTNDADLPAEMVVELFQEDALRVSRSVIRKEVAPNSVEVIELEISSPEPTAVETLPALKAQWKVAYQIPGETNPVAVSGEHRIFVDSEFDAPKTTGPIVVDGEFDDWGALPIVPREPGQVVTTQDAWYGNQDASVAFGVAYDDAFLYVAVDTTDDNRVTRDDREFYQQDSTVVRIDARPEEQRADGKQSLMIGVVPGQSLAEVYKSAEFPEGTQVQSVRRADGYRTEIAVPVAYLNEMQGGDWSSFRMNISVQDNDPNGNAKVSWRPEWDSPANYVGSGTFRKK